MTTSSNAATWLEDNSLYLSAAIAWLRLRLEWCVAQRSEPGIESNLQPAPKTERAAPPKKDSTSRAAKGLPDTLKEREEEARLAMQKIADRMTSSPALIFLIQALGLSRFESQILLLCAAVEFDPSFSDLYARLQGKEATESGSEMPTFALALTVLEDPAWNALAPDGPLRYWRLIEIDQPGFQSLISSPLRADERVVGFLKGLNRLDDRLVPFLAPVLPQGSEAAVMLPPSQQATVDAITDQWQTSVPEGQTQFVSLIQLIGADYASKQSIAAKVATTLSHRLFRLAADALPSSVAEIETLSRLWQRESRLLPLALFLDAQSIDSSMSEAHGMAARRFLSRTPGLIFLCTREGWSAIGRESCSLEVSSPTREERRLAWMAALGSQHEATAGALAAQFNLTLSDIQSIAYQSPANGSSDKLQDRLWDLCLAKARPVLDKLARRIETRVSWEDIVLSEEQEALLRQITAQVRGRATVYEKWGFSTRMNRGLGISALFTGESGTGKTMAAEVIAHDLRLNLYRIDLSAVVSKYIGETEKNLSQLFDAAENGGAILFFDEADALFGKRSEVKDSHDRYANIEINYLLQRMESYGGLAILATNLRSALDIAFTRRLRFIVNFPFPSVADRRRMWKKAYPAKTPVHGLDYDRLARFNLTGGSIANVAINSAFLAAHADGPVTMNCILASIRQEFIKLDRPTNPADFVWEDDEREQSTEPASEASEEEPELAPVGQQTTRSTSHKSARKEKVA